MISRKQAQTYEDIRTSGVTNMWHTKVVVAYSGGCLTEDDCLEIMENYEDWMVKYGIGGDNK